MTKAGTLKTEFDRVRDFFFSRWDPRHQWQAHEGTYSEGGKEYGHCDDTNKIIWISSSVTTTGGDALTVILVHEISHAVATVGHGETWRRRMDQAAARTDSLRCPKLAAMLRKEIEEYINQSPVRAKEIYVGVEDLLMDAPDATYEQVRNFLADDIGMRREELERKYSRLRKVYERGRQLRKKVQEVLTAKRGNPPVVRA